MKKGMLYIGGKWIASSVGFNHINPNTNEVFGWVPEATESEVELAVNAATEALPLWSKLTVQERAKYIELASDKLVEMYGEQGENTEFKRLITDEMGKRLPEADIEVIESSDMARYYVKNCGRLLQPLTLNLNQELWPTKRSIVEFEPVGVVGIIKPWNFPLELSIWSICPALIAGNTVVLKPSEYSSFVAIEIVKIFETVGLPKGVLNLITGRTETGKNLVKNTNVKLIDFTGSVAVGKEIACICAQSLRKCILELGGNDAAIVLSDADVELSSNGLVWGAFCNAGQVCVGVKRVFVHRDIEEILVSRIVKKANDLVVCRDFGPVISESQLLSIEEFVRDAVEKGATILSGGKRIEEQLGNYFHPTVLVGVKENMKIMNEECFGPLLPIATIDSEEEGVEMANKSQFGLGASIWTSNKATAKRISRQLVAGMIWVNDVNVAFPEAPWGGRKNSGIGISLSDQSIYEYVERKHICVDESSDTRRAWWFPYN